MITELIPDNGRKSFNRKAIVSEDRTGKTLYSYETVVCKITSEGEVILYPGWKYSNTTVQHIASFLRQNGYKVTGKKDIENIITGGRK